MPEALAIPLPTALAIPPLCPLSPGALLVRTVALPLRPTSCTFSVTRWVVALSTCMQECNAVVLLSDVFGAVQPSCDSRLPTLAHLEAHSIHQAPAKVGG